MPTSVICNTVIFARLLLSHFQSIKSDTAALHYIWCILRTISKLLWQVYDLSLGFFYSRALSFCPFPLCALFFSPPQLILNDRTIPITTATAGGVNVANSAHPCVESPCANGGSCRPKWDGYECDCPLGYDGRHCQKGLLHVELFSSTDELGWCAIWFMSQKSAGCSHGAKNKISWCFYMLHEIFGACFYFL